jgi:hypothetical protein
MNEPLLVPRKKAARLLGVSTRTLGRLIEAGVLRPVHLREVTTRDSASMTSSGSPGDKRRSSHERGKRPWRGAPSEAHF